MHTFDINLSKLITKAISTAITNDTTKGARGGPASSDFPQCEKQYTGSGGGVNREIGMSVSRHHEIKIGEAWGILE